MTISTDLTGVWDAKEQGQDLFTARAALENASSVVQEELTRFKDIKASGSFTTVPTDLKNALLAWETMFDTLKASFLANSDVQAVYSWRP